MYWALTTQQKNDWLLKKMHLISNGARRQELRIPLARRYFCVSCFRHLLGINRKKWYSLRTMSKEGIVTFPRKTQQPAPKDTEAQVRVIEWMDWYVKVVGQFMPHVDAIHLPPGKWSHVYDNFIADINKDLGTNDRICTFRHFSRVVQKNFPTVKVPPEQRFSKCTTCTTLKAERSRTLIQDELRNIAWRYQKHLQHVMAERRKYWSRRTKGRRHKESYLSTSSTVWTNTRLCFHDSRRVPVPWQSA